MKYPERLHIDYAKDAYRASNKHNYVEQMALWLQHQEAIYYKTAYHAWRQLRCSARMDSIDGRTSGEVVSLDAGSGMGGPLDEGAGDAVPSGMSLLSCNAGSR